MGKTGSSHGEGEGVLLPAGRPVGSTIAPLTSAADRTCVRPVGQTAAVDASLPPGWPAAVRPPGAPDWEHTAVVWLFDLVPPDYRAHEVLRRYPLLLARFARDHVAAGLEAARAGWRTVRVELADELPADAMEAAITAYEREGARLAAAARGVEAVAGALRGARWVPRL